MARRKETREATSPEHPIELPVEYKKMNTFFSDYARNISRGETFIKTQRPLPVGTRFLFKLTAPAIPEPIVLDGEVTRVVGERDAGGPGMGIKLQFGNAKERAAFHARVEGLMQEKLGAYVARGLLARNR